MKDLLTKKIDPYSADDVLYRKALYQRFYDDEKKYKQQFGENSLENVGYAGPPHPDNNWINTFQRQCIDMEMAMSTGIPLDNSPDLPGVIY